jgi:hypothetical protein
MAENQAGVPAVANETKSMLPVATQESLKGYAFLDEHALDIVRENLGGQAMSPSDFERIKFPTGGGLAWEVCGIDGDTESVKAIEGIVLMNKTTRVFWQDEFSGAGAKPDCQSSDLISGRGNPGGLCATCPYSKWGSDPKGGDGQACKTVGTLFVIKPGEMLPIVVPVPVASVGPLKKFMVKLSSMNTKYSNAILSLGLEQMQTKKGIKYSRIKPKVLGVLPEAARAQIDEYIKAFKNDMNAVQLAKEDLAS